MTPVRLKQVGGGWHEVAGEVVGIWAATPHARGWTITHVPTGMCVASRYTAGKAAAVAAARAVAAAFPTFEPGDEKALAKLLAELPR